MPKCRRCHHPIEASAIACPHCQTVLKAYGHPGITVYRATVEEPLCYSCVYHEDDTCTFPQRPDARQCTLYQDKFQQHQPVNLPYLSWGKRVRLWSQRSWSLLIILAIIFFSVLLALR